MDGLDFEPEFEEVLKVNSEMKEGISLRTPDSVVPVLRDEMVYKSDLSASPNKSAPSKPAQNCVASKEAYRLRLSLGGHWLQMKNHLRQRTNAEF
jgi:hypothetical protein